MKNLADPVALFSVLLLAVWAVATFVFEGPGWIHGLLTVGVFLLIYRIVVRSNTAGRER